jgi:small subunit ribosomal protein S8
MINDQISDLLTRIRNAQRAGHKTVGVIRSTGNKRFLEVLKKEGFIDTFEESFSERQGCDVFKVTLKYYSSGKPVIGRLVRVSKPGCRKYMSVEELPKVASGLGIAVLSTSRGVLSDREARRMRTGGEVLALVG